MVHGEQGFKEGERILRKLRFAGIAVFLLAAAALNASAHDWYPIECCHSLDCAPVDKVEVVAGATYFAGNPEPIGPSVMIVTTKVGTVVVPPNFPHRESKDGGMHACIGPSLDGSPGKRLICLFMPPNS